MKITIKSILFLTLSLFSISAFASGFTGPRVNGFNNQSYYTKSVTLNGYIDSRNGESEYYIFRTNKTSNKYIVKINNKVWNGLSVSNKTNIEIHGTLKVSRDFHYISVDSLKETHANCYSTVANMCLN